MERLEISSRSGVVRVPRLHYLKVCVADLTDEREDTYAIGKYGNVINLGNTLLDMQEVVGSVHVAHHQSGTVAIAVEGELHVTRPIELYGS